MNSVVRSVTVHIFGKIHKMKLGVITTALFLGFCYSTWSVTHGAQVYKQNGYRTALNNLVANIEQAQSELKKLLY